MFKRSVFALFASVLLSSAAIAQTGIYATYNASNFDLPNIGWKYGAGVGLYHDMWKVPFFHAGFDARATFIGSGDTKVYSGAIGPRVSLHPHVLPIMPYGEVLVGGGQVQFGQGVARNSSTSLEYRLVAGADWTILPRIDWRVIEYTYSGYSSVNADFNPKNLATGIVVRLP